METCAHFSDYTATIITSPRVRHMQIRMCIHCWGLQWHHVCAYCFTLIIDLVPSDVCIYAVIFETAAAPHSNVCTLIWLHTKHHYITRHMQVEMHTMVRSVAACAHCPGENPDFVPSVVNHIYDFIRPRTTRFPWCENSTMQQCVKPTV